jgi:hypothetical protein
MTDDALRALANLHAKDRRNKKFRNADLRAKGIDPDGLEGRRYRQFFHEAIGQPGIVRLWFVAEDDFQQWLTHCHAGGPIKSHAEYVAQIETIEQDCRSKNIRTERATMRVSDMLAALRNRSWENTSENRARIIGDDAKTTVGLKVGAGSIGLAVVQDSQNDELDSRETPLRENEEHATAAERLMKGER